jgi:hypothetical protein
MLPTAFGIQGLNNGKVKEMRTTVLGWGIQRLVRVAIGFATLIAAAIAATPQAAAHGGISVGIGIGFPGFFAAPIYTAPVYVPPPVYYPPPYVAYGPPPPVYRHHYRRVHHYRRCCCCYVDP